MQGFSERFTRNDRYASVLETIDSFSLERKQQTFYIVLSDNLKEGGIYGFLNLTEEQ